MALYKNLTYKIKCFGNLIAEINLIGTDIEKLRSM